METATAIRREHASARPGGPAVATIREGDAVVAEDGVLGRVDRLVGSDTRAHGFLVVRAGRAFSRRYPVVPIALVTNVDSRRRLVRLRGRCEALGRLPETLPLVL
jgi:hypothetical protein